MALKKLIRKGKPPHRRPSNDPQNLDPDTWYYEAKTHILVVRQVRDKQRALLHTDQIKIPWRKLIASARRCGQIT